MIRCYSSLCCVGLYCFSYFITFITVTPVITKSDITNYQVITITEFNISVYLR